MAKTKIKGGVVHALPKDLNRALISSVRATEKWEDITPLARNEWICWIESAKKPETRLRRIKIAYEELSQGRKRRPCCWAGCIHR